MGCAVKSAFNNSQQLMDSNCLFFVQTRGKIFIPVELYLPDEVLHVMRDCERSLGMPVIGVINSPFVSELCGEGRRVGVLDISPAVL